MIIYVAQAYSKYEQVPRDAYDLHDTYALAINTYWTLTKMGFEVFSPIMYTHPFHLAMKHPNIDYVAHDLELLEGFMHHDTCCSKYSKCIDTIPNEYGYYLLIDRDSECAEETCNGYSHKCEEFMGNRYDSGVVAVFAEDCFEPCNAEDCNYPDKPLVIISGRRYHWVSTGAQRECDFAHAHHIRCIRLAELLEKKKIEECEPI